MRNAGFYKGRLLSPFSMGVTHFRDQRGSKDACERITQVSCALAYVLHMLPRWSLDDERDTLQAAVVFVVAFVVAVVVNGQMLWPWAVCVRGCNTKTDEG